MRPARHLAKANRKTRWLEVRANYLDMEFGPAFKFTGRHAYRHGFGLGSL